MDLDSYITAINEIQKTIPPAALYEQLAEECSELAQVALKRARKMRGENYTPRTFNEIDADISEEVADVILCIDTLDIGMDHDIARMKLARWIDRNSDKGENNETN